MMNRTVLNPDLLQRLMLAGSRVHADGAPQWLSPACVDGAGENWNSLSRSINVFVDLLDDAIPASDPKRLKMLGILWLLFFFFNQPPDKRSLWAAAIVVSPVRLRSTVKLDSTITLSIIPRHLST